MAHAGKLPKQISDIKRADLTRAVNALEISDPGKIAAATKEVEALVLKLYRREQWLTFARDRRAQIDYIEQVRKHLHGLRECFEHSDPGIKITFGANLAEPLSRVLGPQGVAALCPELAAHLPQQSGREYDRFLERRRSGESFEEFTEARATTTRVVEDHCVEVLLSLIEAIDVPLRDVLEFEKENKGGRPPDPYRQIVIREAAEIYRRAVGAPPPRTRAGHFVEFCRQILEAVGLPETVGMGAAIVRHLPR